jgi:hypothetical protein
MIVDSANIVTDEIELEPAHVNQSPKQENDVLKSTASSHGLGQSLHTKSTVTGKYATLR